MARTLSAAQHSELGRTPQHLAPLRGPARGLIGAVLLALVVCAPTHSRAADSESLATRLGAETRAAADRARDAGRKPAEVLGFLGIEPGMTVLDVIASSGYYTEVLSLAVGPEGKVYAQNTQRSLQVREGANDRALTERLADGRLANVQRLDLEFDSLGLESGSLDAAITALNFHDIYNAAGEQAALVFLRLVYDLLEPGGVLGVIDHAGNPGADNRALHRIEEAKVRAVAQQAGFEVTSSDLLRNAGDDRTQRVFDPSIRGKTDRFLLKLRKPTKPS